MSTLNETFLTGLKALEQWRPLLPADLSRGLAASERNNQEESNPCTTSDWPPSLETFLEQRDEYPPYSIILGVCEDGLPFLLDLSNPAPGSLLIAGDPSSGMSRLLKTTLLSLVGLNYPDQVTFHMITRAPEKFSDLEETDHCQQILHLDHPGVGELIEELAGTIEQRRQNWRQDPVIVLVMDDLAACIGALNQHDFGRLYGLIKHGPRARVWTIAALSTEKTEEIEPRFLSAFRTRVIGSIENRELAGYLSGNDEIPLQELEGAHQFCLFSRNEWLRFWIFS